MFIASNKARRGCDLGKPPLLSARRIAAVVLLVILLVTCSGIASAQAPDEAHAYVTYFGVEIEFTACQVSTEANCVLEFSIYRNPTPGFNQAPIWDNLIGNADQASHTITDTYQLKVGQSYTYQVCGGGLAEANRSNCKTTNTVTLSTPPTPTPTPKATPNSTNQNYCPNPLLPPLKLSGLGGTSQVSLKWTNPNQPCPAFITHNVVYRMTSAAVFQQLAKLNKAANNGPLPDRYIDTGPLLPHSLYLYEVCESDPNPLQQNCAMSNAVSTWGADPILIATRVSANTVKLQVAVDEDMEISALSVTREGSDDPCRQGGTLGNGLQGCPTTTSPNGIPTSPAHITTVYNWTQESTKGWTTTSTSAPYVINLPDDAGVRPGVEYYYQAHVLWAKVGQDSAIVTVPNFYATAPSQSLRTGGLKPIGNAPPPPPSSTAARPVSVPMFSSTSKLIRPTLPMRATGAASGAGNLDAAIKAAQAKPGDARAIYALGEAYCANRVKNTGMSYMYMALLLAEKAGNTALAAQIKTSLAGQGVKAE